MDFVGGFVHSGDTRHPEVQIIRHFQQKPIPGVEAEVFENAKSDAAEQRILQFLDENRDGTLSTEEKQKAHVILVGHSWGGGAVMKLVQRLDRRNIPVMLIIEVDGVGKFAPRSCLVPANVRTAVNFYQTNLPIRGCQTFRAMDPAKTTILENIHVQYRQQPPECRAFPWWDRVFLRSHNSVDCDPHVWSEVEKQIDIALGISPITSASE
jgi:pimeloyl-ACP methyl ester carboxylesterase